MRLKRGVRNKSNFDQKKLHWGGGESRQSLSQTIPKAGLRALKKDAHEEIVTDKGRQVSNEKGAQNKETELSSQGIFYVLISGGKVGRRGVQEGDRHDSVKERRLGRRAF